jgi:hypothetical protein
MVSTEVEKEPLPVKSKTMIFRLSQKLTAKIEAGPLATVPLDENPFADWSAHLFVAGRIQYILLSNTKSLYSTVMFGRGITDDRRFIERALSNIRDFMEGDGQEFVYQRLIAPSTDNVRFAKALNRSVTGSMNDLIVHAKALLSDGERAPCGVGTELNEVLLSSLGSGGAEKYGKPRDAFKAMGGTPR